MARVCIKCGEDIPGMGVYVFISYQPESTRPRRGPYCWCAPDEDLLCINCGNNGANTLSYAEYRRLKGVALLPEVPEIPSGAWRH